MGEKMKTSLYYFLIFSFISSISGALEKKFPPLDDARIKQVFGWKQLDFNFPTAESRAEAISSGEFDPRLVQVTGVQVAGDRVFIPMPRWRPKGIPATLGFAKYPSDDPAPPLTPYPDWESQKVGNCDGLTSVFRATADDCGRLWVVDTGMINSYENEDSRICPAKVVAFDLSTDKIVLSYILKDEVAVRNESLLANLKVEYPKGVCGKPEDAVVYIADTTTFAIIVADLSKGQSWRIVQKTFLPDPKAGTFHVGEETYEQMDGIVGMALSPQKKGVDRLLYYSSLASFDQHWVKTSVLRNKELALNPPRKAFKTSYQPRPSQTGTYAMDKNGVLYFGLVNSDSLACWNSFANPYEPRFFGILAQDRNAMQFLAETDIDEKGRLWAVSSRIQKFFANTLDPKEVNIRVFMAESTDGVVKGTICESVNLKKKKEEKNKNNKDEL